MLEGVKHKRHGRCRTSGHGLAGAAADRRHAERHRSAARRLGDGAAREPLAVAAHASVSIRDRMLAGTLPARGAARSRAATGRGVVALDQGDHGAGRLQRSEPLHARLLTPPRRLAAQDPGARAFTRRRSQNEVRSPVEQSGSANEQPNRPTATRSSQGPGEPILLTSRT